MCRFKTQWNNRGHERATKPFTKERRRCVADLLAFTVKRWFKFRSWLRAAEPLFGLRTNIIYCCHRYKGTALTALTCQTFPMLIITFLKEPRSTATLHIIAIYLHFRMSHWIRRLHIAAVCTGTNQAASAPIQSSKCMLRKWPSQITSLIQRSEANKRPTGPHLFHCCSVQGASLNMTAEIWDVVVVGAGLSGLSAAHLLRKRNARLKILILEGKGETLCWALAECKQHFAKLCVVLQIGWEDAPCPKKYPQPAALIGGTSEDSGSGGEAHGFVCLFWLVLRQGASVWLKWSICCSTQTHILELIKELGLETYPQYNVGKKVYHTGGPGAKIHTYTSSIPALSPLVMMDFMQMLWKVRQRSGSKHSVSRTRSKNKCNDVKQMKANDLRGDVDGFFTPRSRDCAQESASRILQQRPMPSNWTALPYIHTSRNMLGLQVSIFFF